MIAPIFLSDEQNIKAVENAIEFNKLVIVSVSKTASEKSREKDSFYNIGVIGNIMRKVSLPDGKIKVLFQGLAKGKIIDFNDSKPLFATVEKIENEPFEDESIKSLIQVVLESIKKLSRLNSKFPVDLIKTLEENDDASRIADLISLF